MKILNLILGNSQKDVYGKTEFLSRLLTIEMVLYIKTRKSHWNISVKEYFEFQRLFKNQCDQLNKSIDEIVDRLAKEQHGNEEMMIEFSKQTAITESDHAFASSDEMLNDLFKDHEAVIFQLRKESKECQKYSNHTEMTVFLENLAEQHEHSAWALRRALLLISIDRKCQSL